MPSDIGEYLICYECEEPRFIADHHCPECDACYSVQGRDEYLGLPIGICNDCKKEN
jgi:Zn ribbon nucleic-acid-binding protein